MSLEGFLFLRLGLSAKAVTGDRVSSTMETSCSPVNSSSCVAFPDTTVLVGNRTERSTPYDNRF
jgi:hypothetical protein